MLCTVTVFLPVCSKDACMFLKKGNIDSSMTVLLKIADLLDSLSSSSCLHLKEFIQKVYEDVWSQLVDVLSK